MTAPSRRRFLQQATLARPRSRWTRRPLGPRSPANARANRGITVLNPARRVPVGLIIDDSTCLVNLNRFAMPQFDAAFGGASKTYLPQLARVAGRDSRRVRPQVRRVVRGARREGQIQHRPYPACVGRLDRELPGWTAPRTCATASSWSATLMMPNWDIHPEMVTHTRVIDTKTGHPYPDIRSKFMENWEWTTGRSADEIADYMAYALQILKNIGLPCEGITTPGGFGNRALARSLRRRRSSRCATSSSAEDPALFPPPVRQRRRERRAARGICAPASTAPIPACVVSIIGCTGDWTGGWDNTRPVGVDRFITADLQHGRMVDVIQRGEPALMLATGPASISTARSWASRSSRKSCGGCTRASTTSCG